MRTCFVNIVLEVKSIGFFDRLGIKCEIDETRKTLRIWATEKIVQPLTEMRKPARVSGSM